MSDTRPVLPPRADVVVIGGGVVGVFAALALAEDGHQVVLCEKGRIAAEQSSRNWGWIRKQGRAIEELPLMLEAAAIWARTASRLDTDIGFGRRGITYLCETEDEEAARATWLQSVRAFQLDTRLLSASQTDAHLGRDDRRFRAALWTPSDAVAEPALAVPAVSRRAAEAGVRILPRCAVRGIERAGGAVSGVVTEHGRIGCDRVVLAGGAWSRALMENEGLSLPQLAVTASALRTGPLPEVTAGGLGSSRASLRRRPDGGFTVARAGAVRFDLTPAAFRHLGDFAGTAARNAMMLKPRIGPAFFGPMGRRRWRLDAPSPFERWRVLDPAPDTAMLDQTLRDAIDQHPRLADARIVGRWAGMIDVTPDQLPVIGPVAALPGLVLATGFSGHGFGIGPGAGRLAADLATGHAPIVDPSPFRLERFDRAVAA